MCGGGWPGPKEGEGNSGDAPAKKAKLNPSLFRMFRWIFANSNSVGTKEPGFQVIEENLKSLMERGWVCGISDHRTLGI